MAKFIIVNNENIQERRINIDRILCYYGDAKNGTIIVFDFDKDRFTTVKETPEEIDALIEKAHTPKDQLMFIPLKEEGDGKY